MSLNAIHFDAEKMDFSFDGQYVYSGNLQAQGKTLFVSEPDQRSEGKPMTIDAVGRIIARACINNCTSVRFERCQVTVNYLVQMLRFVGKYGWFFDCLDTTSDHAFDPNVPTPGGKVGEARRLEAEAAEMSDEARLYRAAYRLDEAGSIEAEARGKRNTARRLRYRRAS